MNVPSSIPFSIPFDGSIISKPGIYSRVPIAKYHGGKLCDGPSISSSGLRRIFNQSPAHYWSESPLNPERIEQDETEALILGRAAHHLLLGEDEFSTLFVIRPDEIDRKPWHGNRTVCRAWIDKQRAEGRTVIKSEQLDCIRGMAKALAAHPLIEAGLLNGAIEQSMCFRDKETDVWLLSRPDAIPNDSGDFADLKTTVEIGFNLDRSIGKYRYDMQAALVRRAAREIYGLDNSTFSYVFVEKTAPFSVDVLTLDTEDLEAAERDLQTALRVFAYCLETGNWFGPSGVQSDARFVYLSETQRLIFNSRREFLEREIAPSATETTTSATDYLSAG